MGSIPWALQYHGLYYTPEQLQCSNEAEARVGDQKFCCTDQSGIYCMDIWFGDCLPLGLDMARSLSFTLISNG